MYKFESIQHVWNFQKAFPGYDFSNEQWAITSLFSNNVAFLDCNAHIQLWQEPIVFRRGEQSSSSLGPAHNPSLSSTCSPSYQHSSVPFA